jgi:hypothetical protein
VQGVTTGLRLAGLSALVLLTLTALLVAPAGPGRQRAVQAAGPGGHYHSLANPIRVLDTRNGTGRGAGAIAAGGAFDLAFPGGVLPASDLQAVVMSVTVTGSNDAGYLTVWPSGSPQPLASNLNWDPRQQVANLVMTGVGSNGQVSIYVHHSQTHVVADLLGYFSAAPGESGGEFRPLMPARILDTRTGLGAPAGRRTGASVLPLQVAGRGNVPGSGVRAVVLQLTAAAPSSNTYLTAFPHGQAVPNVSNVLIEAGRDRSGRVVAGLSGGQLDILNSEGETDVVVDVNGYFTDSGPDAGGLFVPLQPVRVLDTRSGIGRAGQLDAGPAVAIGLSGAPIPAGAGAVVFNLTCTEPSDGTFLTSYPDGNARTLTSDLNAGPGPAVPNLDVVKLGAGGKVKVLNGVGRTHVVADVSGYFTQGPSVGTLPSAPQSLAASAGDRSARLTWSAPADLGGSQVVNWAVDYGTGYEAVFAAESMTAVMSGLTNKAGYNFRVTAVNAAGSGPASNQAGATPLGTADPPAGVSTSVGPGAISLSWSPPGNDGGFPIDHYRITVYPGGQMFGIRDTAFYIGGLSSVTDYVFMLQTVNSYGVGPATSVGPIHPISLRHIVISLGMQTLRAYEAGRLVLDTLVTTGRPELPTPVGSYRIMNRQSPFHFISPWGPESPFWYQDAWVSYAMLFIPGGYFLHDAPWRGWYGPGSQYGDGTHGCVNVPMGAMNFLFYWAQVGDQVDVVP